MYELPASVRIALWTTHAISFRTDLVEAVRLALPDVDAVDGDIERLELWRDLGERAVCVDLPRPGQPSLMVSSQGMASAMDAGECIFVPALGGLLVPRLTIFGPQDDQGLKVTLEAHDSDPVPIYRLEALSLPDIDRRFREALLRQLDVLERMDIKPFDAANARDLADARLASARWALPPDLPPRALRVLTNAALIAAVIDEALRRPAGVDAMAAATRDHTLRALLAEAERAIADAATVASLSIAGLR